MCVRIITAEDIRPEKLSGLSYWRMDEIMPRIDDVILNSSIYLYPSVLEARAGEKAGGSGCIVSVESGVVPYLYAVTNSHVIRDELGNSPVIRINTTDGKTDIIEYTQRNWICHPDGDDLAIAPLSIEATRHKYSRIPTDRFINQQIILDYDIGAGDEVFMVGRFVGYDGKQQNEPTVRFGNLSLGKHVFIRNEDLGIEQESFLIETRSLPGYSGSPVFLEILPYTWRKGSRTKGSLIIPGQYKINGKPADVGPWLLGVDWGHTFLYEKVLEKNKRDEVSGGWVVKSNSGTACVVPAWKLLDLLNMEEFVNMRKKNDDVVKKRGKEL